MVMKGFPGEHVDELKDVQNIEISVVQAEVKTFMETLNAKELILYWVPYQFDFVDASNFLSIWRSDGRHAWKNEKSVATLVRHGLHGFHEERESCN